MEKTMTNENARLYQENYCLKAENAELRKYLAVTDKILADRQRVLEAIPQCEEHGFCVPHALEWIADRNEKAGQTRTGQRKNIWKS